MKEIASETATKHGLSVRGETYLRQSLPAAGIIEESESARWEGGRVG